MRTSTLVEDMPKFEIRDGLVHIAGNVAEYALPLVLVRRAVPVLQALLDAHDSKGSVVTLCAPKRKRRK